MTVKEALDLAYQAGTPIAFIAKNIGRDPSTLNKWLRGTSRGLSLTTEEDVAKEIKRLKQIWDKIDI